MDIFSLNVDFELSYWCLIVPITTLIFRMLQYPHFDSARCVLVHVLAVSGGCQRFMFRILWRKLKRWCVKYSLYIFQRFLQVTKGKWILNTLQLWIWHVTWRQRRGIFMGLGPVNVIYVAQYQNQNSSWGRYKLYSLQASPETRMRGENGNKVVYLWSVNKYTNYLPQGPFSLFVSFF